MRSLVAALVLTPAVAAAQTVSDDVLPTAQERAILFVTNEVRNEPAPWPTPVEAGYETWPCKRGEPQHLPPLEWNPDLAAAARFHANDMYRNDHFDHASSDGTPFARRIARFYEGGGMGENIAWGQSGPVDVLAAWMTSPGHRCNILGADWAELGTGYAANDRGRNPYYVQNFGARGGVDRSRMPAGVAYVQSATKSRYGVNWYDPEHGGDEPTIMVVRESGCTDLSLKAGLPHQGTYDWVGEADGFPESYWFIAVDAAGDVHTYPERGALTTPLPVHSDDRIDDRPMPECAAALLTDGELPMDDPGPGVVPPDGGGGDIDDADSPADGGGAAVGGQPDAGGESSGILGQGRRGRRDQGCQATAGIRTGLKALLRR